ncbi:AAA family ATPase [Neorhizobium galegae]|uniref:AAA family ATPase n=1 Tax=Neorhizobium galegae TaxID=399 RepID=UPI002101F4F8|nr:AAA family ATPase [Neorhizobium galegae]MCQ1779414.1 AAA family ATPase [Neorhizobium galegae]MCQ1795574.1 AAA family ATPase [Neorhizobium galegae]
MPERIPAEGDTPVFIAKHASAVKGRGVSGPYAVITPDNNSWNDYGRGYFADLHLVSRNGKTEKFHLRIMFEGFLRTEAALQDILQGSDTLVPIEEVDIPFVSLLADEAEYRQLVILFGFDAGISTLRKLHDAVVIRIERSDAKLVAMTDEEEFHIGILRAAGASTALRRGSRHFRRDIPDEVSDAAQDFSFFAKLKNATNEIRVDFGYSEKPIIRDRIAVLVGRNGVGKTQLLKAMVDGLTAKADGSEKDDGSRYDPVPEVSRILVFSSVPTDPFPRSIGAWRGIDYEYFAVNAVIEHGHDPLLTSLVACRFEKGRIDLEDGTRKTKLDIVEDALDPLGLWQQLCLPLRPRQPGDEIPHVIEVGGESFLRVNQNLNELHGLMATQQIDWGRSPIVMDANHRPRALSSGEYAMVRFACQAVAAIETGSLLLFDEPETHLHPNYVSDLMEILYALLKATKSIAIIATHSSYVVREVSRENVKVLSVDDGEVLVDIPRLQTFGASIDTISQFVFGDSNMSHHFEEILRAWAAEFAPKIGLDGIIRQYGPSLNPESLSFIARTIKEDK